MTLLSIGTGLGGLAIGMVIGNALAEPTIHHLSAKARLYLELYRASELRAEDNRRIRLGEKEAEDHGALVGFQGMARWE